MAEAIHMGTILQSEPSFLASFSVLVAMGCLCLALSSYFYLKRKAVWKISKDLTANVSNKTFNVFDLDSEKRMIHGFAFFLLLSPLVAFSWTFILVFVVILNFLEAGLILGLVILILSMGFMMIDEASEARKSLNTFIKAVQARKSFGAGDLTIMSLVDDATRRLTKYYLVLGGMFFATFFAIPYFFPAAIGIFAYLVDLMIGMSHYVQIFAPLLTVFLLALAAVATFFAAKKIKARILGFPSPDSLLSAFSASVRAQATYEKMNDVLEWKPAEETW